jgi:hypothetical protein
MKGFSKDGKRLFVYNKRIEKMYQQAFQKVGYVKDLYTIRSVSGEKLGWTDSDRKFLEVQYYAKNIESMLNDQLISIERKLRDWLANPQLGEVFTEQEKDGFAGSVVEQYLRLPIIRKAGYKGPIIETNFRHELMKSLFEKDVISEDLLSNPEYNQNTNPDVIILEGKHPHTHITRIRRNQLRDKIWCFLVSPTNEFYTSDNPIFVVPKRDVNFYPGDFGSKASRIFFPISGKLQLCMWDKDEFDSENYVPNQFQNVTEEDLAYCNANQYRHACNEVFSTENNFDLIGRILGDNEGRQTYPEPFIINFDLLRK